MQFAKVSVFPNDVLMATLECKYKGAGATLIPTDKNGKGGKHYHEQLDGNGRCHFIVPLPSTFVGKTDFCYLRVIVYGPAGTDITVEGGVQMLFVSVFVSELREEYRVLELKDNVKLECPMCHSVDTIIVEALHGKPNTPRWFYHDCQECEFSNALSDEFIVAEPDGSLTVSSTQS